jgi:hypothetical protein
VLVVAPAPLTVQWQTEMREKFDRNFVYDRDTVRTYRQSHPSQNAREQEDRIVTSVDFAKRDDVLEGLRNLDGEKHVTPAEPELVTASFVPDSPPGER